MSIEPMVKLTLALFVTVALFYVMALVMKKLQVGTGRGNNLITVLSALSLGGKERVFLLDIGGEQILVGTSPGHVSRLHVLEKPVDTSAREAMVPGLPFGDLLRNLKKENLR